VPAWGETARSRFDLINARAETVSTTPAFRNAFRSRRCLVPASGFYEWQAEGRHKQPFWFTPEDGAPLALAGLWERWHGDEETIESFAIVTCPANADVAPVHDRMPVILPPEAWRRWLEDPVEDARALMRPAPTGLLRALPVSTRVNRPNIDEPALILQQNSA